MDYTDPFLPLTILANQGGQYDPTVMSRMTWSGDRSSPFNSTTPGDMIVGGGGQRIIKYACICIFFFNS